MLRANGENVIPDGEGGFEMATVYSNGEDKRVVGDTKPSRFFPRYRNLTPQELAINDEIKVLAAQLEFAITKAPKNRERSLAITKLEECVMWAIKGLTS